MTSYPSAIKTWTPLVDGVDEAEAANVNTAYDEITAIETKLGVNVQGSETNLVTRLSRLMNGYGKLSFPDPTKLTISAGSITATYNFHRLDTQGAAASDDLDTITAPASGENWLLLLHIEDDARNVVIKHNTGNIYVAGGADTTLDLVSDLAILQYDNNIDKWLCLTSTTGASTGNNNTWTGYNYFNGGVGYKFTALSGTSVTLDNTYYTVDCVHAGGGIIVVTLPPAATYPGIVYNVRKGVAAITNVQVFPSVGETINSYGGGPNIISTLYESVTYQSDGVDNWVIL